MKHVVSISLGASDRDHQVRETFGEETVLIERRGTDGDKVKARQLIRSLDGQVDAFGLGGTDLYIVAGKKRYTFRESAALAACAVKTPLVDGSGLKNTLERRVVRHLTEDCGWKLAGRRALVVCAVDRFGLAEALTQAGCKTVFGDLLFGLGLPIPMRSLRGLDLLARLVAPVITQFPVSWFYPTGAEQSARQPRFTQYFTDSEIVAGDFHFIKRYMPDDMTGKIIITNTVTARDKTMLSKAGVEWLVTTTPEFNGRSFGTNVLEAVLVALSPNAAGSLTPQAYTHLLDQLDIRPRVEKLSE